MPVIMNMDKDPSNQSGLSCSCEGRGTCITCFLKSMGSLAGSSLQSVASSDRHVCERCHEQTADCVSSDHKKCLCPSCDVYLIGIPSGMRPPILPELGPPPPLDPSPPDSPTSLDLLPPMIHTPPSIRSGSHTPKRRRTPYDMREMYDKLDACSDMPKEAKDFSGKFEAKHSISEIQASFPREREMEIENMQILLKEISDIKFENSELRNEIRLLKHQLLEELYIQSVSQMKKALKKQLNKAVEMLEDVIRGHTSETARRMAGVIPLVKEIDLESTWLKEAAGIKFEDSELLEELNTQCASQIKEAFKKQLNKAVEKLKDVIYDHTSETARRVAGVIPIIKEIDFEGTWLNHASSEEFMELALLGVEDWVDPATIRKVVRHCVCIAKFLGPSYLIAEFVRKVSRRIRQCPQLGFQLAEQYYGVYKRVKDDARGKDALTAVLELELPYKRDAAEHAIEIFHHLNKLIRVEKLCKFTIAVSNYFQRESSKSEEWCKCLTNILEFRSESQRSTAEKCLSDFLHAVRDSNFSEDYLLLTQLLCQRDDSLPVFEVVERLAKMMQFHEDIRELRRVVEGLLVLMGAGNQSHVNTAFSLLIHLLQFPQREELQLLAEGIQGISGRESVAGLFAALVRVLGRVQSQYAASEFGFAIVKWALNHPHQDVALVQRLLAALESNLPTFEESSYKVVAFLTSRSVPCECGKCEACILGLNAAESRVSGEYGNAIGSEKSKSPVKPEMMARIFSIFQQLECGVCHQLFERRDFPMKEEFEPAVYTLECGDFLCVRCLERSYRQEASHCQICSQRTYMHEQELLNMKETCWLCGEQRTVEAGFNSVCCPDHRCCIECLSRTSNIEKCGKCLRQYSAHEQRVLEEAVAGLCLECEKHFPPEEMWLRARDCPCNLCKSCGKRLLHTSLDIERCLHCGKGTFSKREVTLFYNLIICAPLEDADCMKDFLLSRDEIQRANSCPVCYSPIASAFERVTSSGTCPHLFHRDCLRQAVSAQIEEIRRKKLKKRLKCPSNRCQAEINLQHLTGHAALISEVEYHSYQLSLINLDFVEFTCTRCNTIERVEVELTHFECECGFHQCLKCSSEWTPEHDARVCHFHMIEEIVQRMESLPCKCEKKGCDECMIAQCPRCKLPYFKDNFSDNVRCLREGCETAFCFNCSCLRKPTMEHCNTWHRQQCKWYSPDPNSEIINSERMQRGCPECTRLGRFCDPPKDLKSPRRFTLEEYLAD